MKITGDFRLKTVPEKAGRTFADAAILSEQLLANDC